MLVRLAALCLLALPAVAQTITATLTGAVRDPAGAAVPGAALTVVSADTAQKRTATCDADGGYTVSFLAPGAYSITATAKGFGRVTRDGLRLEVAQVAELDLALPLETAQQTVEIHEESPMLVTETSHMETTVENKLITELPSGERSTLSFINLIPGAIDGGFALATGESLNTDGKRKGRSAPPAIATSSIPTSASAAGRRLPMTSSSMASATPSAISMASPFLRRRIPFGSLK